MKDLTKVLFWYGPVELARGPFKKLNGPLDHLIFSCKGPFRIFQTYLILTHVLVFAVARIREILQAW